MPTNRPHRLTAAVLLLSSLLLAAACSGQGAQTRMVEGVLHVMNAAEPLQPDLDIQIVPDITIGGDEQGADEQLFPGIVGIALDEAENIYLAVQQTDVIRVFNPDGSYSRTIGRQGSGPGELRVAAGVSIGADGNVWVPNVMNLAMTVFTPDGAHVKDVRFQTAPPVLVRTNRQGFMGLLQQVRPSGQQGVFDIGFSLRLFSVEGDSLATLFTDSFQMDITNMQLGGIQEKVPVYTVDSRGRIWQTRARTDAYEINVFDENGVPEMVVEKEFRPIRKSETEIEEEREFVRRIIAQQMAGRPGGDVAMNFEPDPYRAATGSPNYDPRGYIWLQVGLEGVQEGNTFDIFDMRGQYLQRVEIPGVNLPNFLTFRGSHLYLTDSDPEEIPAIHRFTVTIGGS